MPIDHPSRLCKCHNEPMLRMGDGHRCAVKMREYQARYERSKKGRAKQARYLKSEKGRAAQARYRSSGKGRAARARFDSSDKRRAIHQRQLKFGGIYRGTAPTIEIAMQIRDRIATLYAEHRAQQQARPKTITRAELRAYAGRCHVTEAVAERSWIADGFVIIEP